MSYKNPIVGYKSRDGYRPAKNRARGKPFVKGADPRRTRQCGQGVVNGDERYCSGCGRTWPKNEDHP